MAFLVQEKMRLRELVEEQQEAIEDLENELREAETAAHAGVLRGALSVSVHATLSRSFSDAGGALSAGISAVLTTPRPTESKSIAAIGCEYEIMSGLGAIVRRSESLKSEQVAELPSGSRVRVLSLSERNPRRVEIVFVPEVPLGSACDSSSTASTVDTEKAFGAAASDDRTSVSEQGALIDSSSSDCQAIRHTQASVVGWISAAAKDGRMLIRPVAAESQRTTEGEEPEPKEEVQEETPGVTLSQSEWESVHRAHQFSAGQVEVLSSRLSDMGAQLLQSFEMRSVLGEMDLGVAKARERMRLMEEHVGTVTEELIQGRSRRCSVFTPVIAPHADECDSREACRHSDLSAPTASSSSSSWPAWSSSTPLQVVADSLAVGTQASAVTEEQRRPHAAKSSPMQAVTKLDWERLLSERETTAGALWAGLQRLASLEREAGEIQREDVCAEQRRQNLVSGLREKLRRLRARSITSPNVGGGAGSGLRNAPAGAASSEALFRRHIEDMQQSVQELQYQLRRARASEADIRSSLAARSSALRTVLRLGALAELRLPQCGPIRMPNAADAERDALRAAVQEQLQWNLQLRRASGHIAGAAERTADARDTPSRRTFSAEFVSS
mmetsp:Transcript_73247/g.197365  ORF Transcript_73247/g.197365 Transcript_73247/m.197365 type:complete len:615 (-) Transcript_73247:7-1851(-)